MNMDLIKIQFRNSIVNIISFFVLYTMIFLIDGRIRINIIGSILLLIFMMNSHELITKKGSKALNLIPISDNKKIKNFIYSILLLIVGMTAIDYVYNILIVGNGPYNLICSLRNIIIFLNVITVVLFILNFLKILEMLIEKIFKRRIGLYKGLLSLYIVFIITIKMEINIFSNVDITKILEVLNFKANSIFTKKHILKSSDLRFIDVSKYRLEKIELIMSKMFFIEKEVIFMNFDKFIINLILVLFVGYINYRVFVKIMER